MFLLNYAVSLDEAREWDPNQYPGHVASHIIYGQSPAAGIVTCTHFLLQQTTSPISPELQGRKKNRIVLSDPLSPVTRLGLRNPEKKSDMN